MATNSNRHGPKFWFLEKQFSSKYFGTSQQLYIIWFNRHYKPGTIVLSLCTRDRWVSTALNFYATSVGQLAREVLSCCTLSFLWCWGEDVFVMLLSIASGKARKTRGQLNDVQVMSAYQPQPVFPTYDSMVNYIIVSVVKSHQNAESLFKGNTQELQLIELQAMIFSQSTSNTMLTIVDSRCPPHTYATSIPVFIMCSLLR